MDKLQKTIETFLTANRITHLVDGIYISYKSDTLQVVFISSKAGLEAQRKMAEELWYTPIDINYENKEFNEYSFIPPFITYQVK